ncbi:hypothetical protein N7539_005428 [Penicillium diatomitis]|uniref:alpha-galactosidase n=1 Tax=Penicillium diatomitis TaxID=2819901 RepID=A0A9W9X854_9EURO|nr:uncharacterized protein N7539_005428 [Penicillium diatomitis]KAJ5485440.1 hypothetical protein N7539_005428 [Penicillium diatomitis]
MSFSINSTRGQTQIRTKALAFCAVSVTLVLFCLGSWSSAPSHAVYSRVFKRATQASEPAIWQPEAGIKWQIQLANAVEDIALGADVYDIDMFDNDAGKIADIHKTGAKVICYFSAGTYEDWRPDANKFSQSDFGSELPDWPGERWLNLRSTGIRSIMQTRLDLAKQKGCDGVDPDNIDAYGNENGLGLTEADSILYLNWLSSEAHSRGMSIGLKNGGDIISSVIEKMQWSVNEQCAQYDECDTYAVFTQVGKPVFHIEYVDEMDGGKADSSGDNDSNDSGDSGDESASGTSSSSSASTTNGISVSSASTSGASSAVSDETKSTGMKSTNDAASGNEQNSGADDDSDDDDDESDDGDDDDNDSDDQTTTHDKNTPGSGRKSRDCNIRRAPKLKARGVTVSQKTLACKAKSADRFSTVIKNMNLDAWVQYC